MTKDEFTAFYAEASGIPAVDLPRYGVVLLCACGEVGCNGWAFVDNSPLSIKTHERLYGPKEVPHGRPE